MGRIAEPDILVYVAGFCVLHGNGSPVNLDSEITHIAIGGKFRRLQSEDLMQYGIDLRWEERFVHNRGSAELERLAFARGIVFAGYHDDLCLRIGTHQAGKRRVTV